MLNISLEINEVEILLKGEYYQQANTVVQIADDRKETYTLVRVLVMPLIRGWRGALSA